jgi:DNA-binding PadR family transcriptional regulator
MASVDPQTLILSALASGPKHGYAITQDVTELAGVTLGPGTLYGAIARLEDKGYIKALPGDDRRRPYELTAHGAQVLQTELKRMQRVAKTGLGRLATGGAA